jgi:hypothetical protein
LGKFGRAGSKINGSFSRTLPINFLCSRRFEDELRITFFHLSTLVRYDPCKLLTFSSSRLSRLADVHARPEYLKVMAITLMENKKTKRSTKKEGSTVSSRNGGETFLSARFLPARASLALINRDFTEEGGSDQAINHHQIIVTSFHALESFDVRKEPKRTKGLGLALCLTTHALSYIRLIQPAPGSRQEGR